MHPRPAELISTLGLAAHPEGGWYRELYRDGARVPHPHKPGAVRSAMTCIWYLLERGQVSAFHRVAQAEAWHHLEGDPLILHLLHEDGRAEQVRLGRDAAGQVSQAVVPSGVWQAAEPTGGYSLCGCTVAPGFDFEDFELASRAALQARFPAQAGLISRLTRE